MGMQKFLEDSMDILWRVGCTFLSTERNIINVETEARIYTVVVKRVEARRDRKKIGGGMEKNLGWGTKYVLEGGCRCHSARYGNVSIQGFYSCKKYLPRINRTMSQCLKGSADRMDQEIYY